MQPDTDKWQYGPRYAASAHKGQRVLQTQRLHDLGEMPPNPTQGRIALTLPLTKTSCHGNLIELTRHCHRLHFPRFPQSPQSPPSIHALQLLQSERKPQGEHLAPLAPLRVLGPRSLLRSPAVNNTT